MADLVQQIKNEHLIELRGKKPISWGKITQKRAIECDDVGMVVKPPYVIVDVDTEQEFQILYKMIEATQTKCRIMRTSRGGHFWFRSNDGISNVTGSNTPVTIRIDIRSHGRESQVAVKQNGLWRHWIQFDEEVDLIPAWIKPMKGDANFLGSREGDGRNSELFNYMILLVNNGLNRTEVRQTFQLINDFMFTDALPQRELDTITRDGAFENIHEAFFDGKRFKHHTFSQYLKNDNYIFSLNGRLYMYNKGFYSDDQDDIQRRMIDYIPILSANQRREVLSYLQLIADAPHEKSPYHIICNNGAIDVRTMDISAFTPEVFNTNKINATYDANAYNEDVDNTLNKICNNDPEIRALIEEMIGYTLLPTSKFQKAFILTGGGSNGKSTFLEMLMEFLGNENVSALSITELNHEFKLSDITSKLANIGDDISSQYIEDSSIFKKLVTGDDITVNVKNESPYKIRNTAKLIFASNDLPLTKDKSDGFSRRLCLIPFEARFSKTDKEYDPFISDKLKTDSARSYLLNLALDGIERIFLNNGFTESSAVNRLIEDYNISNNSALAFITQTGFDFEGVFMDDAYLEYQYWANEQGLDKPFSKQRFNKEVRNNTNYHSVAKHDSESKKTKNCWEVKYDSRATETRD